LTISNTRILTIVLIAIIRLYVFTRGRDIYDFPKCQYENVEQADRYLSRVNMLPKITKRWAKSTAYWDWMVWRKKRFRESKPVRFVRERYAVYRDHADCFCTMNWLSANCYEKQKAGCRWGEGFFARERV